MSPRRASKPEVGWWADGAPWRWPLDALLLGAVLFAAFAYGGTEPWSQQVVAVAVALAGVYTAGLVGAGVLRPVVSWVYVPIAAFGLLILLQVLPLPAGLVGVISPGTQHLRAEALADLGTASAGGDGWVTLSLLPAATWRDARLWVLVVAMFVVVLHAYRDEAGLRRLCVLLMLAGGAVAGFALYQNLLGGGGAYSGFDGAHENSGPFLNHSHFGQFVNLGVGGAVGVVLMRLNRLLRQHTTFRGAWRKLSRDPKYALVWVAASVVVVGLLVVLLSLTRGGVVAALVAGAVVSGVLVWKGGGGGSVGRRTGAGSDKAALLVALGILVVAASLVVGFDAIYERLASLRDTEVAQGGRFEIVTDLWPAFLRYPLFGTGLGTFEFVFPGYDAGVRSSLTTHAENEYVQLMLETGLLGVACIAAFVVMAGRAAWTVLRSPRRSVDFAAYGLCFGWLAILVHSASDFGQHVPAVAMLTAVTTAGLLALSALHTRRANAGHMAVQAQPWFEPLPTAQRVPAVVTLGTLAVAACGAAVTLEGPRQARAAWHAGEIIEHRIYGRDAELIRPGDDERMLRKFAEAAELDPAVPFYRYTHDFYAWGLIGYSDLGEPVAVADDPLRRPEAEALLQRLNAARRAAPTYGPLHTLAGEVRYFGLEDQEHGAALIALGQRLAPHDPYAALTAGVVAATDGRRDQAVALLRRAVALDGGLRVQVVDVLVHELDDPALARELVAGDVGALQHLRAALGDPPRGDRAALAQQVDDEIRAVLTARAYADQPRAGDLAALARLLVGEGDLPEAIELYQHAVALAPTQVGWKMELARAYAAAGDPQSAVREARACLLLRPAMQAANDLINEQIVLIGQPADPVPAS